MIYKNSNKTLFFTAGEIFRLFDFQIKVDPYLLKPIVNLLVFQQLYHTTNFFLCLPLWYVCDIPIGHHCGSPRVTVIVTAYVLMDGPGNPYSLRFQDIPATLSRLLNNLT